MRLPPKPTEQKGVRCARERQPAEVGEHFEQVVIALVHHRLRNGSQLALSANETQASASTTLPPCLRSLDHAQCRMAQLDQELGHAPLEELHDATGEAAGMTSHAADDLQLGRDRLQAVLAL